MRSLSLRTQLILAMLGLVAVTAFSVGMIVYYALFAALVPAGMVRAEAHVGGLAAELAQATASARKDVAAMAGSGSVAGFIAARSAPEQRSEEIGLDRWRMLVDDLFTAEMSTEPNYLQLRLIAADGNEVLRLDQANGEPPRAVPQAQLQDKSGRDYVTATLGLPQGAFYISPVNLNREFGRLQEPPTPVLRVATPLQAADGQRWGILILNLDIGPLLARLQSWKQPASELYVVNASGDFLLHPDPAREFGFDRGTPSRITEEAPELVQALGGLEAVQAEGESVSLGDDAVAAAAAMLAGERRVVVVEVLPDAMATAQAAVSRSALLGGILAAVLAAGLAVVFARRIAQPISAMTMGLQLGGDSDLLPVDSGGEVGILARALATYIERERWHGAILDCSSEAILTTTPDGTITGWNASAVRLFRIPADAAVGLPVEAILPPERVGALRSMLRRVVAGEAPDDELDVTLEGERGRRSDVRLRASPVRSLTGAFMGASIVARDVTDERAAQETFHLATEYSPAAKILVDRAGRVILVNAQLERSFGYGREELLGESFAKLVPEAARLRHASLVEDYLGAPQTRAMGPDREVFGRHKDGSTFPIEVGLTPVPSRDGLLILAAIVDISDRKAAQEVIDQRTRELERSNADLTQFAYVASHDMQEPLRIVASFAQLLSSRYSGKLDDRADQYIDFIVDGSKRMQSLINDILVYSRIGKDSERPQPVDLARVLEAVKAQLRSSIIETGAEIRVEGELPTVAGDAGQLGRLLQNLIGNSIKYRGPESPKITISTVQIGNNWQFTIADNGVGFDEKFKHKIFLMFQRLHVPDAPRGSGLGLAIAKRIVDQHGGDIWAKSSPGEGAAFTFTLPVVPE